MTVNSAKRLSAKLNSMPVNELCEIARKMNADTSDAAGIVLDAALAAIERKSSAESFIAFCEELAA